MHAGLHASICFITCRGTLQGRVVTDLDKVTVCAWPFILYCQQELVNNRIAVRRVRQHHQESLTLHDHSRMPFTCTTSTPCQAIEGTAEVTETRHL